MKIRLELFLLSIFIYFMCFSCKDKFEKNLYQHFEKFIFIDKYEDYEIENVLIIDTLTEKKNDLNKVKRERVEILSNIQTLENAIEKNKVRINNVKYGKVWNIGGITYYGKNSQHIGIYDGLEGDYDNIGKKGVIENLKQEIKKDSILKNDFLIRNDILQKYFRNIQKKEEGKILYIKTKVVIKGVKREGVNRVNFIVIQSPNGEIQRLLEE